MFVDGGRQRVASGGSSSSCRHERTMARVYEFIGSKIDYQVTDDPFVWKPFCLEPTAGNRLASGTLFSNSPPPLSVFLFRNSFSFCLMPFYHCHYSVECVLTTVLYPVNKYIEERVETFF